MRRKISLYIGDQLVDLDDQSFILFNYTMEQMSNPTIVKNSYSQQVTIPGTPANNRIFGEIWKSDRVTQYGGGETGVDFDPTRKTSFVIYNEMSEILEEGYCKLDKITRKRNTVDYTVSLYGNLGAFFYGLSYDNDGNKRSLADLLYTGQNADEHELDFVIDRNAVIAAWTRLAGGGTAGLWDIINFAPAYNGKPSGEFDANRAIFNINTLGLPLPEGYYSPGGAVVVASLPSQYTEWETKDLRSYLQRPVIKFSKIMDAICESYNNGGYEVELDSGFFNSANPYYDKAWMTLPLLTTLDLQVEENSGPMTESGMNVVIPSGGVPSVTYKVNIEVQPRVTVADGSRLPYYLNTEDEYTEGGETLHGFYYNILEYKATAYDSSDNIIQERIFKIGSSGLGNPDIIGYFDGMGIWMGDPIMVAMEGIGISYVRIQKTSYAYGAGNLRFGLDPDLVWDSQTVYEGHEYGVISYDHSVSSAYWWSQSASSARSGVTITKKSLLSSDKTPADYLISYCKMFGLVFLYDKGMKKVSIMRKKSFFQENVIDLTDRVDVSKPIPIVPFSFVAKWYDFSLPYESGEYAKYYANIYDRIFGLQRVNTGYGFNAESINLLNGIVFKGACEVLEASKYFVDITSGSAKIPSIFLDSGGTMTLWDSQGNTQDFPIPSPTAAATISWWNNTYKTYDFLPKVQFHGKENASYEERDTLLFFNGMKSLAQITDQISLTDDTALMMALNNNTPCWILNAHFWYAGSQVSNLPVFSRYMWDGSAIMQSWDFGTPGEVSIPDVTFDDDSSIYVQFWKNYIRDRYDDDSRVMTCKVNLSGYQVNESLLRNFYYYDGCLWVMNRIINHSLTTWDDTECEFVKIQDIDNYIN